MPLSRHPASLSLSSLSLSLFTLSLFLLLTMLSRRFISLPQADHALGAWASRAALLSRIPAWAPRRGAQREN